MFGNDKDKRFEKTYSQGSLEVFEIWVDRETGVNYLYHAGEEESFFRGIA